jgi:tetratricopeptide (TPR) repeat protein
MGAGFRGACQVEIARYFMAQMEWKKAQPYADEAAKTYAGWALLCASECYEGMQDWDKSEELVRAAAERYDDGVVRWYYWCRRTGKGDIQSAEKLVRKHINSLDDHFSQQDLTFFATFYVLAKEPAKALEMFAALSKQAPSETVSLLRMTLLDELSKAEDRNAIMKTLAGKDTPYGNMVKLFSDCLAKDEKGKLDGEAVEKIMKTVPADAVVDANYFVGKFLQQRGHKEEGVKYLQRSASGKNARSFLVKLLAVAELRDQGIEPEKGDQK